MDPNYIGKNIAILGLGLEGCDALKYFSKENINITVFDKKEKSELVLKGINKYLKNVRILCGNEYSLKKLYKYDVIVRSPGVYRYLPEIQVAEKQGSIITSDVKIFFDNCPGKIIGVTGTKGKGTTSTLIYEILKKNGHDVYLAGNIGKPLLELLTKINTKSIVVLELSSFQLIDLDKSPNIAVVLNITTDHLDWHKDKKEYINSKRNIVRYQKKSDYAVINYDYNSSQSFKKYSRSKKFYFSSDQKVKGCYIHNNVFLLNINGKKKKMGNTDDLLLRGMHNWENVNAAILGSYLAGASINIIKDTVYSFKGLEHRLELVRIVNNIKYYNDSFSTNPQTTIAAIKSFDEPVTLILGGSDKGLNYDEMGKEITKKPNIQNIILIGDISKVIRRSLLKARFKGRILNMEYSKMNDIVKSCTEITLSGGVVLLSPSSASFDMFKNYKDRGEQFKLAVKNI